MRQGEVSEDEEKPAAPVRSAQRPNLDPPDGPCAEVPLAFGTHLIALRERLARWASRGDSAVIGEFSASIAELQAMPLGWSERLHLTELHWEAADRIRARAVGSAIGSTGLPFPDRRVGEALLGVECGFSALFASILAGHGERRQRAGAYLLRDLAFRAIRASANALRCCGQFRLPVPCGIWRRMHQLYAESVAGGTARQSVDDNDSLHTVETEYVAALLFAGANPAGLTDDALAALPELVREHSHLLRPVAHMVPTGRYLVVDRDSDRGPTRAAATAASPGGDSLIALPLDALISALEADALEEAGSPRARAARDLADYLHRQWLQRTTRIFGRRPGPAEVRIAFGVTAIARVLKVAWRQQDPAQLRRWSMPATVVDSSNAGFALRFAADELGVPPVGSVVLMADPSTARLSLGMIRWARHAPDESHEEIGVELLGNEPCNATVTRRIGGRLRRLRILVTSLDGRGRRVVVLPPDMFGAGEETMLLFDNPPARWITIGAALAERAVDAIHQYSLLDTTTASAQRSGALAQRAGVGLT